MTDKDISNMSKDELNREIRQAKEQAIAFINAGRDKQIAIRKLKGDDCPEVSADIMFLTLSIVDLIEKEFIDGERELVVVLAALPEIIMGIFSCVGLTDPVKIMKVMQSVWKQMVPEMRVFDSMCNTVKEKNNDKTM